MQQQHPYPDNPFFMTNPQKKSEATLSKGEKTPTYTEELSPTAGKKRAPKRDRALIKAKELETTAQRLTPNWFTKSNALNILASTASSIYASTGCEERNQAPSVSTAIHIAKELLSEAHKCLSDLKFNGMKPDENEAADWLLNRLFPTDLAFDEGIRRLTLHSVNDRAENALIDMLRTDFKAHPRFSKRGEREFRRMTFARSEGLNPDKKRNPDLAEFMKKELAWYREHGFSSEDLKRLTLLQFKTSRTKPATKSSDPSPPSTG
jgi:hypothetical protein